MIEKRKKKMKILVVEDEYVLREVEERALRAAGFETCWTDATTQAQAIIEESGIDLIILDVDKIRAIPYEPPLRGQGLQFLIKMRKELHLSKEKFPVIGTTHHTPPGEYSWYAAFMEAGGNAFLEWPAVFDELVSTVIEVLKSVGKL